MEPRDSVDFDAWWNEQAISKSGEPAFRELAYSAWEAGIKNERLCLCKIIAEGLSGLKKITI